MKSIVLLLHGSIFTLPFESAAQDAASRLCEAWYAADGDDKDEVIPQTLLYLLMRSVGPAGRISDVSRVCALRDGLGQLEVGEASFRSVQESLMRASIHPNYIANEEGRRFMSHAFALHPQLTAALHKTVLGHLPRCRFASPRLQPQTHSSAHAVPFSSSSAADSSLLLSPPVPVALHPLSDRDGPDPAAALPARALMLP
jgi:hypothetical protein